MPSPYEILDPLGTGPESRVHRAIRRGGDGFTRLVAIKVLPQDAAEGSEAAQRLRDEARLLALLRHPTIVGVEDLVRLQGRTAVVLEHVAGADLSALLARGPTPPRPVVELAVQVAGALAAAHEATDPANGRPLGLIHRDVRPDNLRLDRYGTVKLLNFGYARARFTSREAATGYLSVGAMGYLAPESLVGQDAAACDVYALGGVLLALLLGQEPRAWSPTAGGHEAELARARARVAETVGGPFGSRLAAAVTGLLAYAPEARPTARAAEATFLGLITDAPGPWLRAWAAEVVPPVEAEMEARRQAALPVPTGPGTTALAVELLEQAKADPAPPSAAWTSELALPTPAAPAADTSARDRRLMYVAVGVLVGLPLFVVVVSGVILVGLAILGAELHEVFSGVAP